MGVQHVEVFDEPRLCIEVGDFSVGAAVRLGDPIQFAVPEVFDLGDVADRIEQCEVRRIGGVDAEGLISQAFVMNLGIDDVFRQ